MISFLSSDINGSIALFHPHSIHIPQWCLTTDVTAIAPDTVSIVDNSVSSK